MPVDWRHDWGETMLATCFPHRLPRPRVLTVAFDACVVHRHTRQDTPDWPHSRRGGCGTYSFLDRPTPVGPAPGRGGVAETTGYGGGMGEAIRRNRVCLDMYSSI